MLEYTFYLCPNKIVSKISAFKALDLNEAINIVTKDMLEVATLRKEDRPLLYTVRFKERRREEEVVVQDTLVWVLDFDKVYDFDKIKEYFLQNFQKNIVLIHKSVSSTGLKVWLYCTREYYDRNVRRDFLNELYKIFPELDMNCINLSQGTFVAVDRFAHFNLFPVPLQARKLYLSTTRALFSARQVFSLEGLQQQFEKQVGNVYVEGNRLNYLKDFITFCLKNNKTLRDIKDYIYSSFDIDFQLDKELSRLLVWFEKKVVEEKVVDFEEVIVQKYISEAVELTSKILTKIEKNEGVALLGTTGVGKTRFLINLLKNNNIPFIFLSPTRLLCEQLSQEHGLCYVRARQQFDYNFQHFVCTYQKLLHTQYLHNKFVLVCDEFHKLKEDFYVRFLDFLQKNRDTFNSILFISATVDLDFLKILKISSVFLIKRQEKPAITINFIKTNNALAVLKERTLFSKERKKILVFVNNLTIIKNLQKLYTESYVLCNTENQKLYELENVDNTYVIKNQKLRESVYFCTSVVEVGLNFLNEEWDKVVVVDMLRTPALLDSVLQLLGRFRKVEKLEVDFLSEFNFRFTQAKSFKHDYRNRPVDRDIAVELEREKLFFEKSLYELTENKKFLHITSKTLVTEKSKFFNKAYTVNMLISSLCDLSYEVRFNLEEIKYEEVAKIENEKLYVRFVEELLSFNTISEDLIELCIEHGIVKNNVFYNQSVFFNTEKFKLLDKNLEEYKKQAEFFNKLSKTVGSRFLLNYVRNLEVLKNFTEALYLTFLEFLSKTEAERFKKNFNKSVYEARQAIKHEHETYFFLLYTKIVDYVRNHNFCIRLSEISQFLNEKPEKISKLLRSFYEIVKEKRVSVYEGNVRKQTRELELKEKVYDLKELLKITYQKFLQKRQNLN